MDAEPRVRERNLPKSNKYTTRAVEAKRKTEMLNVKSRKASVANVATVFAIGVRLNLLETPYFFKKPTEFLRRWKLVFQTEVMEWRCL